MMTQIRIRYLVKNWIPTGLNYTVFKNRIIYSILKTRNLIRFLKSDIGYFDLDNSDWKFLNTSSSRYFDRSVHYLARNHAKWLEILSNHSQTSSYPWNIFVSYENNVELCSYESMKLCRHGWGPRCLVTFLNKLECQSLRHEKTYNNKWTQITKSWLHWTSKR